MAERWRFNLNREIQDSNKTVMSSSLAVAIKDAIPKAKNHYLVVPKNVQIKNVFELSSDHLPLLDDMFQLAKKLIDSLKMQPTEFLIGFKLDPSMQLLNMHVISTDFMSKHLKKERHWTNFHTNIFLPYDAAYDQLRIKGSIEHLTTNELNKARFAQLQCNRCEFSTKFLFDLKNHLIKHWKDKQISGVEQQQKNQEIVTCTNRSTIIYLSHEADDQQNVSKALPQTNCDVKPQHSLKDRIEALNNMLATVSITNSNATTTTEPGLNKDRDTTTTTESGLNNDLDATTTTEPVLNKDLGTTTTTESGLNKNLGCDQEILEHKENVCAEQQQKEQNASLDLPQNNSTANPQPSLAERLQVLSKRMEILSLPTTTTATESTPTISYTITTTDPILECDVKIDHKIVKQKALEQKENLCEQQQERKNGTLEMPQNNCNVKPQPSLAERLQALSMLLKSDSVKEIPVSTIEPINCNLVDHGLKKDDRQTLNRNGNICEQQQEQQNATLETSQNISNTHPQPSLKDRLAALAKILEKDSEKAIELKTITPNPASTSQPISVKDSRNVLHNRLKTNQKWKKRQMHYGSHQQNQENTLNNGDRSKNEYHNKPKQQYQRRSFMTSANEPSSRVYTTNTDSKGYGYGEYQKKPDKQHQGGAPVTSTNQPFSHGDTPNTSNNGFHLKKQYQKKPKQRYQGRPPAPATSTNHQHSHDHV